MTLSRANGDLQRLGIKPGHGLNHLVYAFLGGGGNYFLFSPLPREDFQFDLRIFFQLGGKKPPTRFRVSFFWQDVGQAQMLHVGNIYLH